MHSKMIDLARTETCWREEAANDNQRISVLWWCLPTFAAWVALVWWALS